jgi:hypothetical protein
MGLRPRQYVFRNIGRTCEYCEAPLLLRSTRDVERKHYCSRSCQAKSAGRARSDLDANDRRVHRCKRCQKLFIRVGRQYYCGRACQKAVQYLSAVSRQNTVEGFLRRLVGPVHRPNIDAADLLRIYDAQKGRCALSGVQMTFLHGAGRQLTNISIDRKNPTAGYVIENVQLVCLAANQMKSTMTNDQLVSWCRAILSVCGKED